MTHGFLQCNKGHNSSKRLIGVSCGFGGLFLSLIGGLFAIYKDIPDPYILLGSCCLLFVISALYLGYATIENIIEIIKLSKDGK